MKASQIPNIEVCCMTCDYYMPVGVRRSKPRGECRRLPPLVTPASSHNYWPTVGGDQWCGEYAETDVDE